MERQESDSRAHCSICYSAAGGLDSRADNRKPTIRDNSISLCKRNQEGDCPCGSLVRGLILRGLLCFTIQTCTGLPPAMGTSRPRWLSGHLLACVHEDRRKKGRLTQAIPTSLPFLRSCLGTPFLQLPFTMAKTWTPGHSQGGSEVFPLGTWPIPVSQRFC